MKRIRSVWQVTCLMIGGLFTLTMLGCGPTYSALSPGNAMPVLAAQGWINDVAPDDLSGKVVVVEAFATW